MKLGKYRPGRTLLFVVVLSVLLATLATLQYRWLGQVSAGERERMQASLHAGALRFSQDFNREISRAYLTFQLDAAQVRDESSGELAERFANWDAKAPYPKLVRDIFFLDKDEKDGARFSHFNRGPGKFELTDWPPELDPLRTRLSTSGTVSKVQEPAFLEGLLVNPIEPNIPALVIPVLEAPRVREPEKQEIDIDKTVRKRGETELSPFAGYLIIKLDRDVITKELIPALANTYFSGSSGLDYNLTVVNLRDADKLVYQSNASSVKPQPNAGDATALLMDIQPEQLDALWFGLAARAMHSNESGAPVEHRIPSGKVVVRTDSQTKNGNSSARSMTVRVFNRELSSVASRDKTTASGPWQLLIQHRSGSLESAVTSARRRNLAVSFGILLLLAGSVAMIVVSTRRAERLANRQIEFVSAVSHEFRTPLSVICSAGENLADGVIDSNSQTKKYGELIRNEGRRLSEMVEQVLEFAGARSGRQGIQLRPVEIKSVVEDALTSYQPVIEEKGYVVERKIEAGLPLVAADGAALRRSLQNLLSNAIKYESKHRWIGIRAQVATNPTGGEVQVIVEDHGIGIDSDEAPHIFEPFYRGREVVESQIHGNGLGLSLVKQVIEAHHGTVSVVSVKGEGSTFTLHLPVIKPKSDTET